MERLFICGSSDDLVNQICLCKKVIGFYANRSVFQPEEPSKEDLDTLNSLVLRFFYARPGLFPYDTTPINHWHAMCRWILSICAYANAVLLAEHQKHPVGSAGCTGYYIDARLDNPYPDHTKMKFVYLHTTETQRRIEEWLRMHKPRAKPN